MIPNKTKLLKEALKQGELHLAKSLDEGLIKSYPEKHFVKCLKVALQTATDHEWIIGYKFVRNNYKDVHSDFGYVTIQFILSPGYSLDDFEKKDLDHALSYCGWFVGYKSKKNIRFTDGVKTVHEWTFEPRFPTETSNMETFTKNVIAKYKKFYHVTFEKYQNRIETDGLVPISSKRKEFIHPDRVYLFTSKYCADLFAIYHLEDPKGIAHKLEIEISKIGKSGKLADMKYQNLDKNLLIYEVDLETFPKTGKKLCLYHDNKTIESDDTTISAVFTYNTIPAKYLKLVATITPK